MSRARSRPRDMPEDMWERATGNGSAPPPEIEDVCASSVETKPVEWLWEGRIPIGKLTMFDGDPDLGKSVVTMDIATRVSTGRPFPDGKPCEAGNVLIVNVEDGMDDTIVPRLKAHGANLERIFLFQGIPDGRGGTRLVEFPEDTALVERKVIQRKAALVILDPIMAMLGGDANKDQDARKALAPIRDMAERTGVAVVAVRHLNKSVGLKAIQRGGGNMGLIGVARAGAFFAPHPEDEGLRVMAAHKSNLAEKPPSLGYRIVSSPVHNTARVEWTGATEHDADSLANGPASPSEKSKLDEAKEFLRDELADGPMWAKLILRDARDAGVAQATLYSAKSALRVRSEKIGVEGWQWSLPPKEDDDPPSGPKDQNLRDLHNLQNGRVSASPDSPYVSEDHEDDDDDEGYEGRRGKDRDHHLRSPSRPPSSTPREGLEELDRLLADPPEWLAIQLTRCRANPGRLLKPTSATLAHEVYGTADRWREVIERVSLFVGEGLEEGLEEDLG